MNGTCPKAYKQRYATAEAAQRAAAGLVLVADGIVMRAYPCPCGWWHLTRRQRHRLARADSSRRTTA